MKVIGFQRKELYFKDEDRRIEGCFIYLSDQNPDVTGVQTERIYLSDSKSRGYIPALGDEIAVSYSKFGKVDRVTLINKGKV